MEEIWVPLVGVEKVRRPYEISNLGNVRYISHRGNQRSWVIAKQKVVVRDGKQRVLVNVMKYSSPVQYLDTLVAKAFVPNPNGYRTVKHIDGNPLNCCANNLVWCKQSELNPGAVRKKPTMNNRGKPVRQYALYGGFVAEYKSVADAARATGLPASGISRSCNSPGTEHTCGVCLWRYADNDELAAVRGR